MFMALAEQTTATSLECQQELYGGNQYLGQRSALLFLLMLLELSTWLSTLPPNSIT
jgi:hypothetical protein